MTSDNPAYAHEERKAIADANALALRPGSRHTLSSIYEETETPLRDTPDFMRRVAQAGRGTFITVDRNAPLSVTIVLAVFRG